MFAPQALHVRAARFERVHGAALAAAVGGGLPHLAAKSIVDGLSNVNAAESLFARGVAVVETSYGEGWGEAGAGSNNWGAVSTICGGPVPQFRYRDSRYDSESRTVIAYEACFKSYATPYDGAADVVRYALRDNVREAVNRGDLHAAVRGMRENKYFLGVKPFDAAVADYERAMRGAIDRITKATGENNPFTGGSEQPAPAGNSGVLVGVGIFATVLGLGYLWLRKK
jgi:hypothetical protein